MKSKKNSSKKQSWALVTQNISAFSKQKLIYGSDQDFVFFLVKDSEQDLIEYSSTQFIYLGQVKWNSTEF